MFELFFFHNIIILYYIPIEVQCVIYVLAIVDDSSGGRISDEAKNIPIPTYINIIIYMY